MKYDYVIHPINCPIQLDFYEYDTYSKLDLENRSHIEIKFNLMIRNDEYPCVLEIQKLTYFEHYVKKKYASSLARKIICSVNWGSRD